MILQWSLIRMVELSIWRHLQNCQSAWQHFPGEVLWNTRDVNYHVMFNRAIGRLELQYYFAKFCCLRAELLWMSKRIHSRPTFALLQFAMIPSEWNIVLLYIQVKLRHLTNTKFNLEDFPPVFPVSRRGIEEAFPEWDPLLELQSCRSVGT